MTPTGRKILRRLAFAISAVVAAAAIVGYWEEWNTPFELQAFIDSHPGWEVQRTGFGVFAATERATGRRVLIAEDDADRGLEIVPCAYPLALAPAWLPLPPNVPGAEAGTCGRMTPFPDSEIYFVNFTTSMTPEDVWSEVYRGRVRERELKAERTTAEEGRRNPVPPLDYRISAPDDEQVGSARISAFSRQDRTTVVVSFRPHRSYAQVQATK